MRLLSTGVYLALTGLVALGLAPHAANGAGELESINCKPLAPLQLQLISSEVVSGVAEIKYYVRPLMPANGIESTVRSSDEASILLNSSSARGADRSGYARVQLPQDYVSRGAWVELEASITFDAINDAGQPYQETQRVVRLVSFGAPIEPDGLETVFTDGEASLDMPAIRQEQR